MISPTSYSLLQRCPRAWWYRYVGRVETPRHPSLAFGTAIHAAIETRITTGAWPTETPTTPEGYQALAQARRTEDGLADLLARATYLRVEIAVSVNLAPYGGVDVLSGRADLLGIIDRTPFILDHKSTANPDYWLTPEQLSVDPQLLAYAAVWEDMRVDVLVGHHYVPPAPTAPAIVWGLATRARIEETLHAYALATVEQRGYRAVDIPEAVPARAEGCRAYGGCPYAGACTSAPTDLKIRALDAQNKGGNVSNTPTNAQSALRARLAARRAAPTYTPEPEPTPTPTAVEAAGIVPPDAIETPEPSPETPAPKKRGRKTAPATPPTSHVDASAPAPGGTPTPPPPDTSPATWEAAGAAFARGVLRVLRDLVGGA